MAESRADQTPDDETLVTPRFDEEETVLAQPVVPLEAAEDLPPAEPPVVAARPYVPRASAPRGPWPLALILVSALVGSVIGGTGLYFFQKQRRAASAQPTAAAPAETTQPAPDAEQAARESAPVEETRPAPAPTVEEAAAVEPVPEPVEDEDEEDTRKADPAPARNIPVREEAPKRGKKGDGEDDEPQRRERNRSSDDDAPVARNEARRVDAIVYPSRRDERRAQRQAERRARRAERRADRQADRLRAIFEGEPE